MAQYLTMDKPTQFKPNEVRILVSLLKWADHVSEGWKTKQEILSYKSDDKLLFKSQEGNFPFYIKSLEKRGVVERRTDKRDERGRKHSRDYWRIVQDKKTLSQIYLILSQNEYSLSFIESQYNQIMKGKLKEILGDFHDVLKESIKFQPLNDVDSEDVQELEEETHWWIEYSEILESPMFLSFLEDSNRCKIAINKLNNSFHSKGITNPALKYQLMRFSLATNKYYTQLLSIDHESSDKNDFEGELEDFKEIVSKSVVDDIGLLKSDNLGVNSAFEKRLGTSLREIVRGTD